jgi:Kef-type K+ transport system membrane component KefB
MLDLIMYITIAIVAVICGVLSWRFSNKDIPTVIECIIVGVFVTYILFYFVAFLICLFATKGYTI